MAMVMPGEPDPRRCRTSAQRGSPSSGWVDKAFVLQRWSRADPGSAEWSWRSSAGTKAARPSSSTTSTSGGVARVYEMAFDGGVWRLERYQARLLAVRVLAALHGTLSADGSRIDGTWEIAEDHQTWKKDFDLIYRRV